jgi:hypothetical protein
MKLTEIIADYVAASPAGVVIDAETATKFLLQAVRFYCGYAELINDPAPVVVPAASVLPDPVYDQLDLFIYWIGSGTITARNYSTAVSLGVDVTAPDFAPGDSPVETGSIVVNDLDLTMSELAIIKPLFNLYVTRENAIHLEASRALGLEVYGRSVAEIESDIKQIEEDLPKRAFCQPIWMV